MQVKASILPAVVNPSFAAQLRPTGGGPVQLGIRGLGRPKFAWAAGTMQHGCPEACPPRCRARPRLFGARPPPLGRLGLATPGGLLSVYGLCFYNEGEVGLWPCARVNGEHTIDVLRRLRAE
jgi:hypothetical protein